MRAGVGVTGFGGDLDVQAVRRLLCDADVTRIVMAGASQVLDVGRATQTWSAPQRRALVARDGGCRGPGCDRPAGWCDAHHIQWWTRDQGPTSVDNGILLCEAHHDLVHHHGWTLDLDLTTATATWHPPDDGPPLLTHPHRPDIHLRPAA